jgi:lipoprotein-anchoring transpeptidase ErfK/SrfK
MASPPRFVRAPRQAVVIAVVTAALVGLLASWMIPATASTSPAPTRATLSAQAVRAATPAHEQRPHKKAVPATRTTKAKHVPAFPRDRAHHGKRIVYDKALMTVWLIDAEDQVVARFPVVGRFDRPAKGTYHIFSKSPKAYNPNSKVTFNWMSRFTYGPDTKSAIGFHAIPKYYDGTPMHSTKQLGLAIARGGCVRLSEKAAKQVYDFLKVGDRVVVLPSP